MYQIYQTSLDIPGWHEYTERILAWDAPDEITAHFRNMYIGDIFKDYKITKVPRPEIRIVLPQPMATYDMNPVDIDEPQPIDTIRVTLNQLMSQSCYNMKSLEDEMIREIVKDQTGNKLRAEIEKKDWTDLFVREDVLQVEGRIEIITKWKRWMGWHNYIDKIETSVKKEIRLFFYLYIGGYKAKKGRK